MKLICGDALAELKKMEAQSVQCCVTSPPYWGLRDYGAEGQLGLEKTPEEYTAKMVELFREVRRVLRDDGTLWLNLGDSYAVSGQGGAGSFHKSRPGWEQHKNKSIARGSGRWGGGNMQAPGLKAKDLVGVPWRVAFALQADGWYLRSDIIWAKPNPMPESVADRPTKAHEYLFLMAKSQKYYYDAEAIKEPCGYPDGPNSPESIKSPHGQGFTRRARSDKVGGKSWDDRQQHSEGGLYTGSDSRNKRSVWNISTQPFPEAHFAVFPPKLIQPCVLAGCPKGGTVLDPFAGSGTTGIVAINEGRDFVGIELNPEYVEMARARIKKETAQQRMFV